MGDKKVTFLDIKLAKNKMLLLFSVKDRAKIQTDLSRPLQRLFKDSFRCSLKNLSKLLLLSIFFFFKKQ
jgi:hypothetical protein